MTHQQQPRLHGIFTPNIVPLDDRGEINERELRRYVDWLIERGVHGLYPNGSTGEFTRFTAEERRRIIEIIADQTAGRVPILAGAAEANTRETIRACEHYHQLGARAVAIVSPFYYKLTPAGVYAYFKEIADHSPIDVTLYNIPMFASPIDVPTVRRLADECPRVVAIKDSSGDLPHMMRMIAAVRPHAARLQLPDRLGCRPDADAAHRLRRRHQCDQRRRTGNYPQAVRPDARPDNSMTPAICSIDCCTCSTRCSTRPSSRRAFGRPCDCAVSPPAPDDSRNPPASRSNSINSGDNCSACSPPKDLPTNRSVVVPWPATWIRNKWPASCNGSSDSCETGLST